MNKFYGRDFLKEEDFTADDLKTLLNLAAHLKRQRQAHTETPHLLGKNIVLIFEKDSTRTRCAFEVAGHEQGAHVTYLGSSGSQIGKKESIADTARVLTRFFDGIEYRGFEQTRVETLAEYATVPVWNGLTNEWHPTQLLADMMTIQEHAHAPLSTQKLAYIGDARYNMGNSLMIGSAMLGLDFRSIAPKDLWTSDAVYEKAQALAKESHARITRTDNIEEGVKDCDFLYTDVWVSMGESDDVWKERIDLLRPYAVTEEVFQMTGKAESKLLHCLPSFHDRKTTIGQAIYERFGLPYMEVADDVFESKRNVVFDEAENRLHTIKAVMVATLSPTLPC
ncbi:MAG: ornithine carbamoyltransferase [Desulfovibrio sp.]|nr:ornithine carbamoyltransferase [Desulfovibrio sp.]